MMVEPPGNARRGRILEIHNGIFVAGEILIIEEGTRTVHQPLVFEVDVLANALAIKARKKCRRAGPVETLVVIKDFDPHWSFVVR
jgi:hypothetical protein